MSNAVRIADITTAVRQGQERLYAIVISLEQKKRPLRTAILKRSTRINFNSILGKFKQFVKEISKMIEIIRNYLHHRRVCKRLSFKPFNIFTYFFNNVIREEF